MLCTVAAMILAFAYRCGGSDGMAISQFEWRTVFPFNPLTEQSKGHLQTRSQVAPIAPVCQRVNAGQSLQSY